MGLTPREIKLKQETINTLLILNNRIINLEEELKLKNEFISNSYKKFGRTFEKFAPFTKYFPTNDLSKFIFLGKPIDGIIFDDDKIKFIEIKTGNAVLTPNQVRVKQQIEEGKVEFNVVRY